MSLEAAYAHVRAGRLAEAEAELRRVIGTRSGQAEALELLGIVVSQQGRAYEALEHFDRAISIRPEAAGARHNRAQALFALGRVAEARAELDVVVAAQPDLHAAWNLLGSVLAAQGDPKAEQAYRRALMLRPDHPETHYNLGVFFLDSGRLEEASPATARRSRCARTSPPRTTTSPTRCAHAGASTRRSPTTSRRCASSRGSPTAGRTTARRCARPAARTRPSRRSSARWSSRPSPGARSATSASPTSRATASRRRSRASARRSSSSPTRPRCSPISATRYPAPPAGTRPRRATAWRSRRRRDTPTRTTTSACCAWSAATSRARWRACATRSSCGPACPRRPTTWASCCRRKGASTRRSSSTGARSRPTRAMPAPRTTSASRSPRASSSPRAGSSASVATTPSRRSPRAGPSRCRGSRPRWPPRAPQCGASRAWATRSSTRRCCRGSSSAASSWPRSTAALCRPSGARIPAGTWSLPKNRAAAFAACDAHIPIGSLPRLLRPSLESFAAQPQALLAADAQRARAFRAELDAAPLASQAQPLVGISWRSFQPKVRGELGKRKSASLAAFHRLSLEARLLDLQYGDTAAERDEFARAGGRLERLAGLDLFNDLDGLLAAIEACDVVVTTSNVTAHLAGSIGKRTLVIFLNARPPFHYWSSPKGRSLWYPSVEIVTAPELDSWERALDRVHELVFG